MPVIDHYRSKGLVAEVCISVATSTACLSSSSVSHSRFSRSTVPAQLKRYTKTLPNASKQFSQTPLNLHPCILHLHLLHRQPCIINTPVLVPIYPSLTPVRSQNIKKEDSLGKQKIYHTCLTSFTHKCRIQYSIRPDLGHRSLQPRKLPCHHVLLVK